RPAMGCPDGCYTIAFSAARCHVPPPRHPRYSPAHPGGRMTSQREDFTFDLSDRVATVTLNRPEKLNALSEAMILGVTEQLRRCAQDPAVGVVVMTGAGRGFCAGGDVSAMGAAAGESLTFEQLVDRQRVWHQLSWLLSEMPKVTIAAVNGPAAGAGLGIALSCDPCFASDPPRFGTAFA